MKLITEGGHFWLKFDNGYTLSCFNGYGSHTENHSAIEKWHKIYMGERNPYENRWESELIEIAILRDGDLVTQNIIESDDSVKTIKANELVEIINIVNNLEDINEYNK